MLMAADAAPGASTPHGHDPIVVVVDDPDAVVDYLLKSKHDGVLAQVPLQFNAHHQVMGVATEVCVVKANTSDSFDCALEQPPANPPPGDPGG